MDFTANRNAAHRQCARDNKSLINEDDSENWRCPDCVENALEPDSPEAQIPHRRASAPKVARDLLPAHRGAPRPDSHSVFNSLILENDPLDGSRSLRKRKASSDDAEVQSKASSKRQKKQPSADLSSEALESPSPSIDDIEESKDAGVLVDSVTTVENTTTELDSITLSKPKPSRPPRPRRPRPKKERKTGLARIVRRDFKVLVIALPSRPSSTSEPPKKRQRPPPPVQSLPQHPRFATSQSFHHATPFYSFHERENDELKSKPYGGILSEAEADTSKTLPQPADRARFDDARQKAEDEWKQKTATAEAESEIKPRASQKLSGPPSKIKCISFGGFEIETWYAAPYPEEYSRNRVLYICEFCLKYMNSDYVAWRHKLKCPAKHPPGDEIYRDKSVSVFEVDGRKNPVYCQNLCLLAKLFLGSKTLYYDVEPFLFYIMTEYDELGCHFVGYFSKEKRPSSQNNVSCILTLPIHQRKGYGNLLIDFSYLLTRVEQKTGSPEKPLSDMGLVSYRNYWRLVLSRLLLRQQDHREPLSITDISESTGMTADDIVAALEALRALVRDPVTKTYALRLDYNYFRQCIEGWEAKDYVKLNPEALVWTPYIMGRSNLAHYDRAPLSTVAPREGEEDERVEPPKEGVQQQIQNGIADAIEPDQENKETGSTESHGVGTIDLVNQIQPLNTTDIKDENQKPATTPTPTDVVAGPPPLTPTPTRPSLNEINHELPIFKNSSIDRTSPFPPPTQDIPPTRYEVFPPVPGTTSRRRGGWRGGPRKSTATATPSANATPTRPNSTTISKQDKTVLTAAALGKSPRILKPPAEKVGGKSPRVNGVNLNPDVRRTRSTLGEIHNAAGPKSGKDDGSGSSTDESEDEDDRSQDVVMQNAIQEGEKVEAGIMGGTSVGGNNGRTATAAPAAATTATDGELGT